jgi:glycosyltransferase involved in cell wall biosynthesis
MKKVVFLLCSDVVGGHEFQAVELALTAKKYCDSSVFLNSPQHIMLIKDKDIRYYAPKSRFFKTGNFIYQFYFGLKNYIRIRRMLQGYEKIIICAGTIEAGISSGIALWGKNIYLYVPIYIDRAWLWGSIGNIYNCLSPLFVIFYKGIITINWIQGSFFCRMKKTFVVPNIIENRAKTQTPQVKNRRLYYTGRLEKDKRVDGLITWLDNERNPFKELIVIGDGSQKDLLIQKSLKCKYLKVAFYGWLNRTQQENILFQDDILVFNSLYEGEPLVIREANSRKSLVITRNIMGIRGCTYPANRFNTQEELLNLLELAYLGKLRVYENQTEYQINKIRDHVAKQIFV